MKKIVFIISLLLFLTSCEQESISITVYDAMNKIQYCENNICRINMDYISDKWLKPELNKIWITDEELNYIEKINNFNIDYFRLREIELNWEIIKEKNLETYIKYKNEKIINEIYNLWDKLYSKYNEKKEESLITDRSKSIYEIIALELFRELLKERIKVSLVKENKTLNEVINKMLETFEWLDHNLIKWDWFTIDILEKYNNLVANNIYLESIYSKNINQYFSNLSKDLKDDYERIFDDSLNKNYLSALYSFKTSNLNTILEKNKNILKNNLINDIKANYSFLSTLENEYKMLVIDNIFEDITSNIDKQIKLYFLNLNSSENISQMYIDNIKSLLDKNYVNNENSSELIKRLLNYWNFFNSNKESLIDRINDSFDKQKERQIKLLESSWKISYEKLKELDQIFENKKDSFNKYIEKWINNTINSLEKDFIEDLDNAWESIKVQTEKFYINNWKYILFNVNFDVEWKDNNINKLKSLIYNKLLIININNKEYSLSYWNKDFVIINQSLDNNIIKFTFKINVDNLSVKNDFNHIFILWVLGISLDSKFNTLYIDNDSVYSYKVEEAINNKLWFLKKLKAGKLLDKGSPLNKLEEISAWLWIKQDNYFTNIISTEENKLSFKNIIDISAWLYGKINLDITKLFKFNIEWSHNIWYYSLYSNNNKEFYKNFLVDELDNISKFNILWENFINIKNLTESYDSWKLNIKDILLLPINKDKYNLLSSITNNEINNWAWIKTEVDLSWELWFEVSDWVIEKKMKKDVWSTADNGISLVNWDLKWLLNVWSDWSLNIKKYQVYTKEWKNIISYNISSSVDIKAWSSLIDFANNFNKLLDEDSEDLEFKYDFLVNNFKIEIIKWWEEDILKLTKEYSQIDDNNYEVISEYSYPKWTFDIIEEIEWKPTMNFVVSDIRLYSVIFYIYNNIKEISDFNILSDKLVEWDINWIELLNNQLYIKLNKYYENDNFSWRLFSFQDIIEEVSNIKKLIPSKNRDALEDLLDDYERFLKINTSSLEYCSKKEWNLKSICLNKRKKLLNTYKSKLWQNIFSFIDNNKEWLNIAKKVFDIINMIEVDLFKYDIKRGITYPVLYIEKLKDNTNYYKIANDYDIWSNFSDLKNNILK